MASYFKIWELSSKASFPSLTNELEKIKGIGTSTAEMLLKKFKSVKKIKQLNLDELADLIGKSKAELVFKSLKQ